MKKLIKVGIAIINGFRVQKHNEENQSIEIEKRRLFISSCAT
jgi:hypothetical protein